MEERMIKDLSQVFENWERQQVSMEENAHA